MEKELDFKTESHKVSTRKRNKLSGFATWNM